eukprot:Selendium_serpulae@DN2587_c0_g1_i2.p2
MATSDPRYTFWDKTLGRRYNWYVFYLRKTAWVRGAYSALLFAATLPVVCVSMTVMSNISEALILQRQNIKIKEDERAALRQLICEARVRGQIPTAHPNESDD